MFQLYPLLQLHIINIQPFHHLRNIPCIFPLLLSFIIIYHSFPIILAALIRVIFILCPENPSIRSRSLLFDMHSVRCVRVGLFPYFIMIWLRNTLTN